MTPTERETARISICNQREALVIEKLEHQTSMTALKNKVRSSGMLPAAEYRALCNQQNHHMRSILDVERKLGKLNQQLRELSAADFAERGHSSTGNGDQSPIVSSLVALRQEYQTFSADGTRVASMRQMASEFVLKLNPIIRRAVGSDK